MLRNSRAYVFYKINVLQNVAKSTEKHVCRRKNNWFAVHGIMKYIDLKRYYIQKQPSRGVLIKRCSENMQQIYRRTSIFKYEYDFNKVVLQKYWNCTLAWVFFCKFAAYFQNTFFWEHLWRVASVYIWVERRTKFFGGFLQNYI